MNEHGALWHDLTAENWEVFEENPVPLPLCPPQFPYGLAWD